MWPFLLKKVSSSDIIDIIMQYQIWSKPVGVQYSHIADVVNMYASINLHIFNWPVSQV